jgi:hypothetical protein
MSVCGGGVPTPVPVQERWCRQLRQQVALLGKSSACFRGGGTLAGPGSRVPSWIPMIKAQVAARPA